MIKRTQQDGETGNSNNGTMNNNNKNNSNNNNNNKLGLNCAKLRANLHDLCFDENWDNHN